MQPTARHVLLPYYEVTNCLDCELVNVKKQLQLTTWEQQNTLQKNISTMPSRIFQFFSLYEAYIPQDYLFNSYLHYTLMIFDQNSFLNF